MVAITAFPLGATNRARAGRPAHVIPHGKKREHGRISYSFMLKEQIPFRIPPELAICCVQSWRATYIGWNDGRT